MFESYFVSQYTSNKKYRDSINQILGGNFEYLNELCKNCGYPRGTHYSFGGQIPRCATIDEIIRNNPYLIPEFRKINILIKVI